jgi:hypothetical protein
MNIHAISIPKISYVEQYSYKQSAEESYGKSALFLQKSISNVTITYREFPQHGNSESTTPRTIDLFSLIMYFFRLNFTLAHPPTHSHTKFIRNGMNVSTFFPYAKPTFPYPI